MPTEEDGVIGAADLEAPAKDQGKRPNQSERSDGAITEEAIGGNQAERRFEMMQKFLGGEQHASAATPHSAAHPHISAADHILKKVQHYLANARPLG